MNLGEMAAFVCNKVRHTDSVSVTRCKEFLNARYTMVYDSELWRASLFCTYASAGENGVYFLPDTVDSLVAVRADDRYLRTEQFEQFFRIDYNLFSDTGNAYQFSILQRCVWDRSFANASTSTEYINGNTIKIASDDSGDLTTVCKVTYIDSQGRLNIVDKQIGHFNGSSISGGETVDFVFRIISITKPVTAGTCTVWFNVNGSATAFSTSSYSVGRPEYTNFPQVQPFQVVGSTAETLLCLFKVKCPGLPSDNSVSIIPSLDNCLMAFAQADMLERERQYGKAQICVAEGGALLNEAKKSEVYEQAYSARVVPDGEPMNTTWNYYGWLTNN